MSDVIAYDVLRLFIGPTSLTPRGIDRVDLALARRIFVDPAVPHVGILPTPMGTFVLDAPQVRRLLAYLDSIWENGVAKGHPVGLDPQLVRLVATLTGQSESLQLSAVPKRPKPLSIWRKAARMVRMLAITRCWPRISAVRGVPIGAHYLNVGQLGLAMPRFFRWLDKRPDVVIAMMIHDAIPILYPDLVGKEAPNYHRQMIRTAVTRANGLIFNSAYTRDSVAAVIGDMGYPCPPGFVRSLPLPAAFEAVDESIPELANTRYFIAVSTVEPRKNYALLLRVWQRLIEATAAPPHLVIVGSPGRQADVILAPLVNSPAIGRKVHYVAGLSSSALASLLLGATGMLCPSLAEGFGLPLLEASAMGVPALASDIPAHRELATDAVTLLALDDEEAWARAITALPDAGMRLRPPIPYEKTEAAYCRDILQSITRFPASHRSTLDGRDANI